MFESWRKDDIINGLLEAVFYSCGEDYERFAWILDNAGLTSEEIKYVLTNDCDLSSDEADEVIENKSII